MNTNMTGVSSSPTRGWVGMARWPGQVLLLACVLLAGCGPLVTLYSSQGCFDCTNNVDLPKEADDGFLLDAADRFGLMALFAELVYRKDIDQSVRDGAGCAYLDEANAEMRVWDMPHALDRRSGWERWVPDAITSGVEPCFDGDGLYYETYVHRDAEGKLTEAVIAFRGTENRSGQWLYDWGSNAAAALGLEPTQYALASQRIPVLVAALHAQLQNDGGAGAIYATGHSLGGGLAQQAGYLSRHVKAVFAFNSSPVTNWSQLRLRGAVQQGYPVIYRVYHGGEALEKVRFVSTSLTQARFGRHDIGIQFTERRLIAGHEMRVIACGFAGVIARRTPHKDAAHHYSWWFVSNHVAFAKAGKRSVIACPP